MLMDMAANGLDLQEARRAPARRSSWARPRRSARCALKSVAMRQISAPGDTGASVGPPLVEGAHNCCMDLLGAIRAGDREALGAMVADDVVFNGPVTTYQGRDQVVHLLALIGSVLDDITATGEVETVTFVKGHMDGEELDGVLIEIRDDRGPDRRDHAADCGRSPCSRRPPGGWPALSPRADSLTGKFAVDRPLRAQPARRLGGDSGDSLRSLRSSAMTRCGWVSTWLCRTRGGGRRRWSRTSRSTTRSSHWRSPRRAPRASGSRRGS